MSLSPARISELLRPYTVGAESFSFAWPRIHEQLAVYLDLLLKWNARVNLTAIRSPEEIVRHPAVVEAYIGRDDNDASAARTPSHAA